MGHAAQARNLRRRQTREEKQLWQALRAGRFAGFKFRRQHPFGAYFLDFYCPQARLSIELDGFQHGTFGEFTRNQERERFLQERGIETLRFWNRQWRSNREGVLLEIWHAVHRRTGCLQTARKEQNYRYKPLGYKQIGEKPPQAPFRYPWD
jgi:ATP-dependent helicase HrpA/adenine-specific DNA-methyltransferase